jgi:hypothetical protein
MVKTLPWDATQLAEVLPLTRAHEALSALLFKGAKLADLWGDLLFLGRFALLMLWLSAFTLRQEKR